MEEYVTIVETSSSDEAEEKLRQWIAANLRSQDCLSNGDVIRELVRSEVDGKVVSQHRYRIKQSVLDSL